MVRASGIWIMVIGEWFLSGLGGTLTNKLVVRSLGTRVGNSS